MDIGHTRYRLVFAVSFIAVLLERLWNSFWAALCVVVVYTGLGLLGLPAIFGNAAHICINLAFLAAAILVGKFVGAAFSFPRKTDIDRRIETASGLAHRPLEMLRDRPIAHDAAADILWKKYITRISGHLKKLSIVKPLSTVPRQDRHALRHGAFLFLILGVLVAGRDAPHRLLAALTPDVHISLTSSDLALDVWIEPPAYTNAPTAFISKAVPSEDGADLVFTVPEGSILKVRASGSTWAPRIFVDDKKLAVEKAGDKSFMLDQPLTTSGTLEIKQGFFSVGSWYLDITPDKAPEIEILATGQTPQAGLKITYRTRDDYALESVRGYITAAEELPHGMHADVSFDMSSAPSGEDKPSQHVEDLTYHILAGLPVYLTLEATDGTGKTSKTAPLKIILPERKFKNAAAQRIVFERKRLFWFNNRLSHLLSIETLTDIANQPGVYKGDIVVFLSLASAVKRLIFDGDDESVSSVIALLWDVALKIEDGGLAMAARELREALQNLSQKLEDKNASESDIQEAMAEVQQKMQQYMQALANDMQQRMAEGKKKSGIPPEMAEKFMQHLNMSELMEQMRQMQQGDAREQMQKMADFMKNMMDRMSTGDVGEMQEGQQKAMEALQKMQDIITGQQELMDKTGKKSAGDETQEEAQEQKDLRGELGDVMRELGETMPEMPESLGQADQAMKKAGDKLGQNDAKGSLPEQKEALDALQKGMDDAIEQIAQQMQQFILSFGMMPQGDNYGEGFDPLGREQNGKMSNKDIGIPDEGERRRVQKIIDELRSRSNDYNRPKIERDYLDRLLDNFY